MADWVYELAEDLWKYPARNTIPMAEWVICVAGKIRRAHEAHCTSLTPELAERIAERVWNPFLWIKGAPVTKAELAAYILRIRDEAAGGAAKGKSDV